jgi:pimeloyl-ACP methyl ester carboxylesterase
MPVSIFHGTSDFVIPYRNAKRLEACLKPGDEFITVSGGGHNDLGDAEVFRRKLDSLLMR